MFRLTSLDPDTNVQTNWTVGSEENEQLGGVQTREDLQEGDIRVGNTAQYLFKQEGKRLYNATKTRALRVCPLTKTCKWTKELDKASDFTFVRQQTDKEHVWLVAENERLVLSHDSGRFQPYSDKLQAVHFLREPVASESVFKSSLSSSSSSTEAVAVAVTPTEDDRWGNWIYVLLIFFLVLLVYFIYLLDLATCVFSSKYKPKISAEVKACSADPLDGEITVF